MCTSMRVPTCSLYGLTMKTFWLAFCDALLPHLLPGYCKQSAAMLQRRLSLCLRVVLSPMKCYYSDTNQEKVDAMCSSSFVIFWKWSVYCFDVFAVVIQLLFGARPRCVSVSAVKSEFLSFHICSLGTLWIRGIQCSLNFADRLLFTDLSQKTGVVRESCGGK